VIGAIAAGFVLLAAFGIWESRHAHPMLPLGFFRNRAFSAANAVSLLMYFGMFGSIFLLSQFFQVVQGYSPFQAGLRTLPWTGMPIFVAPIAGILAGRIGGRPILAAGMALQAVALAWLAAVVTPTVAYEALVVPFILAGIGMGLFFAPIANVVLSAVRPDQEGKASGATNTIREVGGVFGVAVLAAIFSANGSYGDPVAYVDGLQPAIAVGALVVGLGAVAALFIPARAGVGALASSPGESVVAAGAVGDPA
jgi:MFS family permease